jgi:hypothetical protein
MIQLTTAMVRALAGAPMTVLVLLMIEGQPLAQAYIRRHTGFSEHTVQDSVELLNDYLLINQTGRYTWQIAAGVQRLPLGMDMLPEPEITHPDAQVINVEAQDVTEEQPGDEAEEIRSHNMRPNSMSSLESRSGLEEKRLEKESSLESSLGSSSNDPKTRIEQNLAECTAHGIAEPARTKISEKPHVTPEYIRYIFAISENHRHAVGRMLKNWDSWSWKAKSVSMETVESIAVDDPAEETVEAVEVDDQAAAWWIAVFEKLRELLPTAIFSSWVKAGVPARRVGDGLFVLASNEMVGEKITQHVCQDALNDLVKVISGGCVNRICFVTHF